MNFPVQSKTTDRHEKHVFPLGSQSIQKHSSYDVADVHNQDGVVRDPSFGVQGLDHVSQCPRVFLNHNGISNGTTTVSTFQEVTAVMEGRNMFIAGVVLIGLAILTAVVFYFFPRVFGTLAKFVVSFYVTLFLIGLVLMFLDRKDML